MAKVRWFTPGPDDPMFKEGCRSYSPHWARPFHKAAEGPPLPVPCPCGSGHARFDVGDDNNDFMFYACEECYERVLAEYNAGKRDRK
jgi:hypothetical protein